MMDIKCVVESNIETLKLTVDSNYSEAHNASIYKLNSSELSRWNRKIGEVYDSSNWGLNLYVPLQEVHPPDYQPRSRRLGPSYDWPTVANAVTVGGSMSFNTLHYGYIILSKPNAVGGVDISCTNYINKKIEESCKAESVGEYKIIRITGTGEVSIYQMSTSKVINIGIMKGVEYMYEGDRGYGLL